MLWNLGRKFLPSPIPYEKPWLGNEVVHILARKIINQSNMNQTVYLPFPPPLVETKMLTDKDGASSLKLVVHIGCYPNLSIVMPYEAFTVACNIEQI